MASISFQGATRRYAADHPAALDDLSLDIADGEFCVLVGPSGSGKSTALRMLAGLEACDAGRIHIGGRDVTNLPPKQRDIAMVFQNYALYPHMTVAQNMGFALRISKMPKDEVAQRVAQAAELLDLEPYLDRRPKQLSGGQRQRVAMGRAIVREPQVFLMDEPLSNLDAKLRVQTRTQIASLQRRLGVTTVYVTHDQVEAMTMGDRVAVLRDGVLQQCGAPRELYERPANAFVAGFIGSPAMNLLELPLADVGASFEGGVVPLPRDSLASATQLGLRTVTVGIRPEALRVAATDDPTTTVSLEIVLVEELGADAYLYGTTPGGHRLTVRVDGRRPPARGSQVGLVVVPEELHVFATEGGQRL